MYRLVEKKRRPWIEETANPKEMTLGNVNINF
jgi:hypothetical protein